jgi:hypothetical protein
MADPCNQTTAESGRRFYERARSELPHLPLWHELADEVRARWEVLAEMDNAEVESNNAKS